MKNFRDSNGTEWTVFEVRRHVNGAKGEWSYLPNGFSNGWLCFEHTTAKRRLIRFPARWRELSDGELQRLLEQAQPAPRTTFRLSDDLVDPSTSPDLRAE